MDKANLGLDKLIKVMLVIAFIIAFLYFAQSIIIPLFAAFFLALLLKPVCSFFDKKLPHVFSISLTFFLVLILLSSILYFFGTQFYDLFQDIKNFGDTVQQSVNKVVKQVDQTFFPQTMKLDDLVKNESRSLIPSKQIIENTITLSTNFIVTIGLVFVYSFLFLLYRNSFERFILYHFEENRKDYAYKIIQNIQKVAQNYFLGLIIVITLLGTLNGFGLWIIGLDYPFLFGYFAALLTIIPYIGTFLGGLLPSIYALIHYDNIWIAAFVVFWYMAIQALEGNILTPNIVGSKVSLNPLVAIIALITGGLIWGVAGMILFIPILAVVKVIFDSIDPLKPYGLLLSSDFGSNDQSYPLFKKLKNKIKGKIK